MNHIEKLKRETENNAIPHRHQS